jgi:predicted flap endonuclease-1-like 5' DNA nuclease
LRAELADARAQIARLRLQVRQREDRIIELERALSADQRVAEEQRSARAVAEQRLEQLQRELEQARACAVAPPDDLKRIPGIGPGFERALHELGVTSFAQIAAWTLEDVQEIALRLRTPPRRIVRDGWVERARELAQG